MHLHPALTALVLVILCPPALGAAGCDLSRHMKGPDPREIGTNGLSDHFRHWLTSNGYESYDFPRDDLPGGSFGGRRSDDDPVSRQPVVFVHGNSDRAVGWDEGPIGWTAVISYLLANGYSPGELYATTWGPADPIRAGQQTHSYEYVASIRAFIEAVLAYTGAKQVDVIAHSMGVTLARKALQGGMLEERDLGPPLTDRIDTFVGIAGGNRGLTACFQGAETLPTCSAENGFFPGEPSFAGVKGLSNFLEDLNDDPGYEAQHVYSIWSRADQLVGFGGLVYGAYTSRIPGQDGEKVYRGYPYGHFCVRDLSAPVQLQMIRSHRVP